MSFRAEKAKRLPAVQMIYPDRHGDPRGYFQESFKASDFQRLNLPHRLVQLNVSKSVKGVLRGIHFQNAPFAQGKLIQVLKGRAWTVAVDLQRNSPAFGQWEGFELGEDQPRLIYLPPGFGHGFLALEDCLYCYLTTEEYSVECESGVRWDDPDLAVIWPLPPTTLSEKDQKLPWFREIRGDNGC